jgi:hypothetical protein
MPWMLNVGTLARPLIATLGGRLQSPCPPSLDRLPDPGRDLRAVRPLIGVDHALNGSPDVGAGEPARDDPGLDALRPAAQLEHLVDQDNPERQEPGHANSDLRRIARAAMSRKQLAIS